MARAAARKLAARLRYLSNLLLEAVQLTSVTPARCPHPQVRSHSRELKPAPALSQVAKRRATPGRRRRALKTSAKSPSPRPKSAAPKRMADIKDIFGESDSEDDNAQQQAPVDVGKLFELSEDEEEAPIQRKRPAGRLQKNAAAAPPKKKDEGGAYDDEDDGVRDCVEIEFRCASSIINH